MPRSRAAEPRERGARGGRAADRTLRVSLGVLLGLCELSLGRNAWAQECRPLAMLQGDAPIVNQVVDALASRPIDAQRTTARRLRTSAPCRAVEARVWVEDQTIQLQITDEEGRSSTRVVQSPKMAALLIESFASAGLLEESGLDTLNMLEPPLAQTSSPTAALASVPGGPRGGVQPEGSVAMEATLARMEATARPVGPGNAAEPAGSGAALEAGVVETKRPKPARSQVGFGLRVSAEIMYSNDRAVLYGARLGGCVQLGWLCLGFGARLGVGQAPGRRFVAEAQRLELGSSIGASAVFQWGPIRLSPGLFLSPVWMRTTATEPVGPIACSPGAPCKLGQEVPLAPPADGAFSTRLEAQLSTAIALTRALSIQLDLGFQLAPFTAGHASSENERLAGVEGQAVRAFPAAPVWLVSGAVGLRWGLL